MVTQNKKTETPGSGIGAKELIAAPLNLEVSKSFLEYSMSVVYSRALPSIVDGLKPVQRRILYSMYDEGYTPDNGFVKSAKPVSTTMGNFHPHGDSSIYLALVKMAQDFYLNVPLVEGYGNFGDITGSGPAASRYTECRLSKESVLLLSELRDKTVPMKPNYSDDLMEPEYLPVQFPNLLINGNFGIAVGFASNFAQHNGAEALNAAKFMLKNPDATVQQLMRYIPGPDFPTGGTIIGKDGIISAYETGQGIIKIRGKYQIVSVGRGKNEIIFSELPYGAKTEVIITKIKEGLKNGKLTGIADAKDLTDHANGLKFVIEAKAGVNPQTLVNELFRLTPLEESFGINNTCLVDGQPKTVGLVELLQSFLDHRVMIVTKRTEFRRDKKASRLHLVEGLLKALANIDEVIRIVRGADDATQAQTKLMTKFKIDEIQADYILAIPLRRLTKFDQIELNDEKQKLISEIAELNKILNDKEELKNVISQELDDVKKVLKQPRRSFIADGSLAEHMEVAKKAVANVSVEVADEPCSVYLLADGSLLRSSKTMPSHVVSAALTSTRGKFLAITNRARAYRLDTLHVGESPSPVELVLPEPLSDGEQVIAVTPVAGVDGKTCGVAMGTKNGVVKLQPVNWPTRSDDFNILALAEGDEVVNARWVPDVELADYVFVTSDSSLLTFPAKLVRGQAANSSGGMAGIKLAAGQQVVSFDVVFADEKEMAVVVTVTNSKNAKMTPLGLYPAKGRGTGGVRSQAFLKNDKELVFATVGTLPVLLDTEGEDIALPELTMKRDASGKPLRALPTK